MKLIKMQKFLFLKNKKNEKKVIKKDNNFPKGTKYEEELNSNFKYFNIFWYDPNKSNDFDNFRKCFENVQFNKAYDLDSINKFFKNEYISEWIVITPGSKGEELIKNLDNIKCIKSFFIYCRNPKLHENWTNNYKKIGCLTSSPEVLCQKFIEINREYMIPYFNYEDKTNIDIISWLKSDYNFKVNSSILKEEMKVQKIMVKNLYNNLCIKYIIYFSWNEFFKDFAETNTEKNSTMNLVAMLYK